MNENYARIYRAATITLALTGLTACAGLQFSPERQAQQAQSQNYDNTESGAKAPSTIEFNDGITNNSTPQRGPASLQVPQNDPADIEDAINSGDIALGMSRNDVRQSWGMPSLVEVAGADSSGNERWTYTEDVPTRDGYLTQKKIILFRTNRVVGWKTVTNNSPN